MGYKEPSPKRTSPPCSGGGRSVAKNVFELAMIMLKNYLKLSVFIFKLFLLYFVCPVWFAPHLVLYLLTLKELWRESVEASGTRVGS
jgi:hypothetical protein